MYIQLYDDLRKMMNDNESTLARENAKTFINYSLRDIANEYDWEFLRGSLTFTPTANGVYDLNPITQLTGMSANIYGIASASADNGLCVQVYGKRVQLSAYTNYQSDITVSAGVTASASQSYTSIDAFIKPVTSGSIIMTNGSGNIIATLGAADTVISNDIRKVNSITDSLTDKQVVRYDYNTFLKGNPNQTLESNVLAYDIDYGSKIRVFNLDATTSHSYTVIYQRLNRPLVNDYDRTEFPETFYQDIIMYAWEAYGKRYQDEADAINGSQLYLLKKELINDIIRKWVSGTDKVSQRIIPRGFKRIL